MSEEVNCLNCCIDDFKHSLCGSCHDGFCARYKSIGDESAFFENVKRDIPRLMDDGTLCVRVDDYLKVKRVLVQDKNNWGGMFYNDNDETARPRGEWIYHKEVLLDKEYYPSRFECDQCHHFVTAGNDRNFCPNCGADMRGTYE